jgi:hypothetical protein
MDGRDTVTSKLAAELAIARGVAADEARFQFADAPFLASRPQTEPQTETVRKVDIDLSS